MAIVEYIRKKENSKLLLLGISKGEESLRYTVDEAVYAAVGAPSRGEELSDSQLSEIEYSDEYYRAKKKALSLLALADNSLSTLKFKLRRAGIGREIAERVAEEMTELGYVNEDRQLAHLVSHEANEGLLGPYKILPRLVRRGYRAEDIRRAISSLTESGEVDFSENSKRLAAKKLGKSSTREEKEALLYKYGYKKC